MLTTYEAQPGVYSQGVDAMLPSITTTHAVPHDLPATHFVSTIQVKFCKRCLRILDANERSNARGKRKASHRCDDLAAAQRPSVSVPFN
jgi:hypothetical protein